jgi:hypothetical protein
LLEVHLLGLGWRLMLLGVHFLVLGWRLMLLGMVGLSQQGVKHLWERRPTSSWMRGHCWQEDYLMMFSAPEVVGWLLQSLLPAS